jgi:hypothetical protein
LKDIAFGNGSRSIYFRSLAMNYAGLILADDQDLGCGEFASNNPSRIQTVHPRHRDVHQDNVWSQGLSFLKSLESIHRLAADEPIGASCEQSAQAAPDGFSVVNEKDAHRTQWFDRFK